MHFYEHRASDFLSKIAGASFIPSAHSERFQEYIDEIMSGDREKAKFLQKSLGYAVSGDTRHECLFFLYGETSRNGKGTLMESVLKVLGDYGRAVRPETIAQKRFTNSQAPSEDIARPVSYTHLDVYKRQPFSKSVGLGLEKIFLMPSNKSSTLPVPS